MSEMSAQLELDEEWRTSVPCIRAGETLYSWCGRVHEWTGQPSVRKTSLALFGHPSAALLHDFPALLNQLSARVRGALEPPRSVALQRTLLGYFLVCQTSDTAHALLEAICESVRPFLKYELGIPAARMGARHPLKWCVQCAEMAIRSHGYSAWRLVDQFPTSLVCVDHGDPLRIFDCTPTPVHRREWFTPESAALAGPSAYAITGTAGLQLATNIATFSARFAQLSPASLDPSVLNLCYRHRLRERGLLSGQGSLRLGHCVKEFRGFYDALDKSILGPLLCGVTTVKPGLLAGLLRASSSARHPGKHILLSTFLYVDWDDFKSSYARVANADSSLVVEKSPTAPRPGRSEKAEREFLTLMGGGGLSVSRAAKHVGVAPSTGVRWAKRNDLAFTSRAKSITAPVLKRARALLATGASKSAVATSVGISVVSVSRLLSSEPATKRAWDRAIQASRRRESRKRFLALVEESQGDTLKALRRHPGNGYTWLYRHDRAWLRAHIPSLWQVNKPAGERR